ncbi:MAG TPA: 1-acyl-sn-glycerol-3-phosphate acyltransferase [Peptococcaceae bacterium]|nr:1-acyl-sn-glycerol-3-phosphate acyltransferase [Peptococcaceae bacterium]
MYLFFARLTRCLLRIVNGKTTYLHQDRIPEEINYVMAAPHRTYLDAAYIATALYPREIAFLAKQDLFSNRFLTWLLTKVHAIPVNRENPGTNVIRQPVRVLREGKMSVGIFPSGSRGKMEIKGGAALIAKMGKVPILPVVYDGPLTLKDIFARRPAYVNIGELIYLKEEPKLGKEEAEDIAGQVLQAFQQLTDEIMVLRNQREMIKSKQR